MLGDLCMNITKCRSFRLQPSLESSEVIPETDDEDEDDNERSELHVFSPRTRRSITGRRSMNIQRVESDEDDIFSDEDHNIGAKANDSTSTEYRLAETTKLDESPDAAESDQLEKFKRNRSFAPNDSTTINTPKAKRFSINSATASSTPSRSIPDIEFSDKSDDSRSSGIHISHSEGEMKSALHDSSIVLLNSSDEENRAPANTSKYFNDAKSSTPSVKLIQPKLQFGTAATKAAKKFVSRNYYDQKADAIAKAKQELKDNEQLYQQLANTLPDKGENLSRRINQMKNDLRAKENELATFLIEEDHLDEVIIIETEATNSQQPKNSNWRDDLEAIQPRHTGQQGMSTFNTQKTLTLNRIERLHKAMDKCPKEHELAKQPENLNVQLMPHQLHAIKWMSWRETQSPKGGILADDMGLGTLLLLE